LMPVAFHQNRKIDTEGWIGIQDLMGSSRLGGQKFV
jgi:hypothetical protein